MECEPANWIQRRHILFQLTYVAAEEKNQSALTLVPLFQINESPSAIEDELML